ncbi:MAG: hypothetical protein FWG40_03980 [Peptococcaceae bacterium]|nr:hypothetical protein [Peptococcaceae bacterium]
MNTFQKKSAFTMLTVILVSILISMLLTACTKTTVSPYPFVEAKGENTILLIDRINETQFSYDTETYQVVETMDPKYTVYPGDLVHPFHTVGPTPQTSSAPIQTGYCIINLQEKQVTIEQLLSAGEIIYPLAFSDNHLFFMKSQAGTSLKDVVRYDPATNTLTEYPHLQGYITYGAVSGDTLYYTVFTEIGQSYTLYQADCTDENTRPQMVRDGLNRTEIYTQGNDLYLADNRYLYCGEKRLRKESLNYFIGDKYLLQYVASGTEFDAVILNTETGETVKRAPGILGVSATDKEIIMYCQGDIERFQH